MPTTTHTFQFPIPWHGRVPVWGGLFYTSQPACLYVAVNPVSHLSVTCQSGRHHVHRDRAHIAFHTDPSHSHWFPRLHMRNGFFFPSPQRESERTDRPWPRRERLRLDGIHFDTILSCLAIILFIVNWNVAIMAVAECVWMIHDDCVCRCAFTCVCGVCLSLCGPVCLKVQLYCMSVGWACHVHISRKGE